MNIQSNKIIVISILTLIIIFIIIFSAYLYLSKKIVNQNDISPTVTLIPTLIFPTLVPQPSLSASDTARIQTEADNNWTQKSREIDNNYPWLDAFPIQTPRYFVYFDIDEKKFIAKIYDTSDIASVQKEVIEKIQDLQIDTTKYQIEWREQK